MVAKSTIKLIDEAIIPAMVLIIAKIAGILLVNHFLKISYSIQQQGFLNLLPAITYQSAQDYIKVENYSNLLMFTAAALGTLSVLIRAHLLHESHISPKFHQRLAKFNLEKLVSSNFNLYHKALIWILFLWLITLFLLISALSDITYTPVAALAIIISINFSWILALDIQREIEISGDKINKP